MTTMHDVLFSPVRLDELEILIQNSVRTVIAEAKESKADSHSPDDELLTTSEAQEFLKASKPTLLAWRKLGLIRAIFFGRAVRYRKSDLLKLSTRKHKATSL